ncbi:MAG: hypothetical protein ACMVO5_00765 [Polymorphobacter sp.]|uniref:hypothetical protein n=1 Tax=Polymorphobacter sp. TaxID=1909290 RepID=UPI003A887D5B
MGKPRSSKSAEIDFDDYVERRISELGLSTNLKDIRTAATHFENVVVLVEGLAVGLLVFAAICLGFILYTVARTPELSAGEVLSIALAGTIGLLCVFVGTRPKRWGYGLWRGSQCAVKCRQQSNIDAVLHEVNAGNHSIMRLTTSGAGAFGSPVSNRPVDLILSQNVLSDPWIAATLFGSKNKKRRFIVVTPEPTGDWFNFYLWHPPVAQELLHLFDKTPDIYPDERIKRLKVRIALQVIIDLVSANAEVPSPRSLNKSNVVKRFRSTLKIEASRLLQAGEINDLEERLLSRVNITGDDPSFDPAAEGKKHTKKPHSWFLELKGGRYAAVIDPLSKTVQAELNLSPRFIA